MMIGKRPALLAFRNSGSPKPRSFAATVGDSPTNSISKAISIRLSAVVVFVSSVDSAKAAGSFSASSCVALWDWRASISSLPRVRLPTSSSVHRVGNVPPGIDHPDLHVITTAPAAAFILYRDDATQGSSRYVCARPGDSPADLTRCRPTTAHRPGVRKLQEEKTKGKSIPQLLHLRLHAFGYKVYLAQIPVDRYNLQLCSRMSLR